MFPADACPCRPVLSCKTYGVAATSTHRRIAERAGPRLDRDPAGSTRAYGVGKELAGESNSRAIERLKK
eukprot:9012075-Pyramimonas_sp.AAC.2